MAVPDTTTFTLQDVVTEVNPTTDDLVDCFADAVSLNFDPAYEGSKNQLLNFRNYGPSVNTTFYLTSSAPKGTLACDLTANNVAYHNGANPLAGVGNTVYTNLSGTITYAAGTYGEATTSSGFIPQRIVVDASGVVTGGDICF